MRILYLRTGIVSEQDVKDTINDMGYTMEEYDAPLEHEKLSNDYAVGLLGRLNDFKPDFVLCLRYFSAVSIVCNAAKVKYVAWVCKSYEPEIYSYTLLNENNYIFFADKSLADEFSGGDFKHIYYLPLCVNDKRISSIINNPDADLSYDSDITMMQNIEVRRESDNSPLSKDSELKDATKGYLEGCLACQHQLSGLPSMAGKLPGYVMEDLLAHFPPKISGDSIETPAHYYDYNYFNSLITYSQRDIHFHNMVVWSGTENANLYNAVNDFSMKGVTVNGQADYLTKVPLIARKSKINVVVTHRNWRSAIPQISWDIMASGGFLITNIQMDYFELFDGTSPVMYETEIELRDKGKEYLGDDAKREEIAKSLSEEVMEKHTYKKRIESILEKL